MNDLTNQWHLGGMVAQGTSERNIQSFTCCATHGADGWRMWYSVYDQAETSFGFGYLDYTDEFRLLHDTPMRIATQPAAEGLNILGVPTDWNLIQPVHLRLKDGRERLYFWAFGDGGVQRYLAADSNDGINFIVEDWHCPVLYHPNDRAISQEALRECGLSIYCHNGHQPQDPSEPLATPEMLMNDATNVYLLPDGTFELYSAEVVQLPPDAPLPRQKDPLVRQIQRRVSADGVHWSAPQHILSRTKNDLYDLQFYYLSVTHTPLGRIGILGHYRSDSGTMDMEFCRSQDGVHWEREGRPGFPREKGVEMLFAPHNLVCVGGLYYLFYSGSYLNHHGVSSPDAPEAPSTWIGAATIPVSAFNDLLPRDALHDSGAFSRKLS
ncbi:MAG: hypothetical protein IKR13_05725 [Victivallales bacterium]|nr:hypothetical protein [Victivallales bacterium]